MLSPDLILVQNGALELESGELSFEAGSDGRPRKVEGKTPLPMMGVVAEMMIFANAAVAHRIAGAFPGAALLRRHAPPRPEGFEQVCHAFIQPLHPNRLSSLLHIADALFNSRSRAAGFPSLPSGALHKCVLDVFLYCPDALLVNACYRACMHSRHSSAATNHLPRAVNAPCWRA